MVREVPSALMVASTWNFTWWLVSSWYFSAFPILDPWTVLDLKHFLKPIWMLQRCIYWSSSRTSPAKKIFTPSKNGCFWGFSQIFVLLPGVPVSQIGCHQGMSWLQMPWGLVIRPEDEESSFMESAASQISGALDAATWLCKDLVGFFTWILKMVSMNRLVDISRWLRNFL